MVQTKRWGYPDHLLVVFRVPAIFRKHSLEQPAANCITDPAFRQTARHGKFANVSEAIVVGLASLDDRLHGTRKSGASVTKSRFVDLLRYHQRSDPAMRRQSEPGCRHDAQLVIDKPVVKEFTPGGR